jgi:curved DNA-binding protein CbpA
MKNPYEVLNIKEGASEEEIKKAYIELCKKYHPDKYSNNPLKDLAEEKMREINEAYDYLMENKNNNGYSNKKEYTNDTQLFREIRMDIQGSRLKEAEEK